MPKHWLGKLVLLAALLLALVPAHPVAAQGASSPPEIVRSLSAALDTLQARIEAGDQTSARTAYDTFENVWFDVEGTVRSLSGGSYRAIEDAMRDTRDAVGRLSADPGRARTTIAALRGQIASFAAQSGAAPSTAAAAPAASSATASAPAASAPAQASGTSTEDCARYSGRAALPYFEYARTLAAGGTIPGIPPAQAVQPIYSYGPSPFPGTVAAGPYRPIYPYGPQVGPGLLPYGGRGVGAGNQQYTAAGLINAFQTGGQLPFLPNAGLGAAVVPDIIALAGQQAAEVGNRIGIADVQQNVVANQLGYSDLRSTWVGTYLSLSEQARDIALSLCGRIPG